MLSGIECASANTMISRHKQKSVQNRSLYAVNENNPMLANRPVQDLHIKHHALLTARHLGNTGGVIIMIIFYFIRQVASIGGIAS